MNAEDTAATVADVHDLLSRHRARIVRVAAQLENTDEPAAEDAMQEAALDVLRRVTRTDLPPVTLRGLPSFLIVCVRRRLRRQWGRSTRPLPAMPEVTPDDEELLTALDDCIDKLPEHLRQLIQQHYHRGVTQRDIAAATRRSPASVCNAHHRALALIARCLGLLGGTHG